jgi:hypothetical protein
MIEIETNRILRAIPANAMPRAPLVLRARAAAVSAPPGVAIDDGAPAA